ncbi:MAG: hypothetical protein GY940_05915, partial [bacterium]|nr:hypothetical protein [bacterium]
MTKDNSTMESMKLEIHSITIVSSIIPSIAGFPVPLPNWNPHVSLGDGLYSQRPGVFEIARKNSAGTSTLKVEVSLTNPGDHTSFTLTGTLDGIVFSGTFDKRGSRRQNRHRQTVEVTARDEP